MLYVEDDADVAESTVAILESIGARVRVADSADAAIETDLSEIDIVFFDVMMPGRMDGIELAQWLAERHPDLPVVLTSGYMVAPERLQALDVQFVRKPFTIGKISDALVRALRNSGAYRQAGVRSDIRTRSQP